MEIHVTFVMYVQDVNWFTLFARCYPWNIANTRAVVGSLLYAENAVTFSGIDRSRPRYSAIALREWELGNLSAT